MKIEEINDVISALVFVNDNLHLVRIALSSGDVSPSERTIDNALYLINNELDRIIAAIDQFPASTAISGRERSEIELTQAIHQLPADKFDMIVNLVHDLMGGN